MGPNEESEGVAGTEVEAENGSGEADLVLDIFNHLDDDETGGEDPSGSETQPAGEGEIGSADSGGEQAGGSPDGSQQVSPQGESESQTQLAQGQQQVASGADPAGSPGQQQAGAPEGGAGAGQSGAQDQQSAQQTAQQPGAPQQQPGSEGASTNVLEALRAEVDKNKDVFINALAQEVYKLDQSDMDELDAQPAVAIPKLLAKSHFNIVQNVLGTLAAQIPHVVGGVLEARKKQESLEDEFFTRWKDSGLDRSKHRQQVLQIAQAYRQLNPNATKDQMMEFVGAQAVVMLGLHKQPAVQPSGMQPQAAKPLVPQPAAFQPAGQGVPAAVTPAAQSSNPWERTFEMLGDEPDEE